MNGLDAGLIVAVALAALFGWRLGLMSTLASLVAVVLGGSLGFALGRRVTDGLEISREATTLVLMAVIAAGIIFGQALAAGPVQRVHDAVAQSRVRYLNSAGGAALTMAFVVVIVWMLATALTLSASTQLASLMRGSTLLVQLDETLPSDAGALLQRFETGAGLEEQSRVFTGLGLLPVPAASVPTAAASTAAQEVAEASVVRVMGSAECGTGVAGTGVVVADELVLTNAHVVAGVREPYVFGDTDRIGLSGEPVWFDPIRDMALLRVPHLDRPVVPLTADPQEGDVVAVAGYSNAGPLTVKPSRVRGSVTATSSDIFGVGQSQRQVLVVAGDILPGDSGGPLLTPDGRIVGLVFAGSLVANGATGYALAASEVARALDSAATQNRVDTGGCSAG